MEGQALKVMRCRCFLSRCKSAHKAYCGVETERVQRQNVTVVNEREEKWDLIVDFVEDQSCRCMSESEYDLYVHGDVAGVPFSFNHTWVKRPDNKKERLNVKKQDSRQAGKKNDKKKKKMRQYKDNSKEKCTEVWCERQ